MKIAFIGLGIMGESMCENIIKKHTDTVFAFDIDKSKTALLESKGAKRCKSANEAVENAEIIISMVPKSEHSRSLYAEILPVLRKGSICIDMSTIDPFVSVEIAKSVKAAGSEFADAPVVKSKPAAIAGTLGIYVGSSEEIFERIKPILSYMGSNIIYMGENGRGLIMKVCHNTLVAEIQNGVNETLALALKNDINIDDFAKAVSYGGGQNFYLDSQAAKLREADYSTAFSFENMHKDLGICESLAAYSGVSMPGAINAKAVYEKGMEIGLCKEDFRATFKVVKDYAQEA